VQDCVALRNAYLEDVTWLSSLGLDMITSHGDPRVTIGSVAWATADRICKSGNIMNPEPVYQHADWGDYDAGARSYYGGRVEAFRDRARYGVRDDVNSMYPWGLTHDVPVGSHRPVMGREAERCYDAAYPGCYLAHVTVPHSDVPLLPMRAGSRETIEDHDYTSDLTVIERDRLVWATGAITGWYTHPELSWAESRGAQIRRIDHAAVWPDTAPIYQPYVEKVYGAREAAMKDGDTRRATILKWFANALSGKLAQGPDVESATLYSDDDEPPPLGSDWGGGRLYIQHHERLPTSGFPIQAAYVTSRSRIKLGERLLRNDDALIYCDTDAVYLAREDATDLHPTALGSWKREGTLTDWIAIAPKMYAYTDEKGEEVTRTKGIPRASRAEVEVLREGGSVTARVGVKSLREAEGDFSARTLTRTGRGNRRWCGLRRVREDGSTAPLRRAPDGRFHVD
jgi:hypothetical protein